VKWKILIIIIILILTGFSLSFGYFLIKKNFLIGKKTKSEAEVLLTEFVRQNLKAEFVPSYLNVNLQEGFLEKDFDQNLWGAHWSVSGKNFYASIDYNNERPGIDSYKLAIYEFKYKELNETLANQLLQDYFILPPSTNIKCTKHSTSTEKENIIINQCLTSLSNGNKKNWLVISLKRNSYALTIIGYELKPIESESYEKEIF
jgi:hypothetical protein